MLPVPGSPSRLGRVLAITSEGREALSREVPDSAAVGFSQEADGLNEREPAQTT
jgi:hypothetical protein